MSYRTAHLHDVDASAYRYELSRYPTALFGNEQKHGISNIIGGANTLFCSSEIDKRGNK